MLNRTSGKESVAKAEKEMVFAGRRLFRQGKKCINESRFLTAVRRKGVLGQMKMQLFSAWYINIFAV